MTITRASHCKVNLLLNTLGKRDDGFHELETIFYPVFIHDYITVTKTATGIRLTCNNPALPTDRRNLVFKAAELFLNKLGVNDGLDIHLEKRLPIAGGIGAGSANAAVTLQILNELFNFPFDSNTLHELATQLGSDVPFFLESSPAIAYGRGEKLIRLKPLTALSGLRIILIHPGFGVSTAWAYKELANYPDIVNGEPGKAQKLAELLQTASIEDAVPHFYNSFERPVFKKFPILQLYKEFLITSGALTALMSGSGSTIFALVKSREDTEQLIEKFKIKFGKNNWIAIAPLN